MQFVTVILPDDPQPVGASSLCCTTSRLAVQTRASASKWPSWQDFHRKSLTTPNSIYYRQRCPNLGRKVKAQSSARANKDCLIIIRTLFLLTLFAVNFHAFNFELEEVWGHFWIALKTSYLKMPPNFPSLKIKGMKIDSKNRQQNKRPDNFETVLMYSSSDHGASRTFQSRLAWNKKTTTKQSILVCWPFPPVGLWGTPRLFVGREDRRRLFFLTPSLLPSKRPLLPG